MAANVFTVNFSFESKLLTKRGHGKLMRAINRQMARRHKERIMPKHFSGGPETKPAGGYRYETRSKTWQKQKLKLTGRNVPLVFKGKLAQTVASSSRITATQNKWTFRAKSYFPMRPERRAELQAVAPAEIRENKQIMKRLYVRAAKGMVYREYRRERIRS